MSLPSHNRAFALLAILALVGCQADEITRYTAPRSDEPAVRLVAAIFSQPGERSWVFKLQGPEAAVAAHAEEFTTFIRSVRFAEKAEPPVTWTMPAGWRRDAERQGRFATLRVGPEADAPELTVSLLTGPQAGDILANVNRWRRQLGLRDTTEAALPQVSKKLAVDGGDAVIVDMSGPGGGRMPAPPPVATNKGGPIAGGAPLTFQKPDGWTPYKDPKGFATVAFHAGPKNAVDITASRLEGTGGGLAANINRWRGQIGLPDATKDEMDRDVHEINIAGGPALLVDLLGPEAAGGLRQRIIGIVLLHGNYTWFFKMRGPPDQVGQQQRDFMAFVGSVRFADRGGE